MGFEATFDLHNHKISIYLYIAIQLTYTMENQFI